MIVKPQEFTYEAEKQMVQALRQKYPFAEFEVIGRSWAGRAVFSMSIGEGTENVLFLGGMRGQEYRTPMMLFKFFERLCEGYAADSKISAVKIKSSLSARRITIIPCANPDSVEIAARAAAGAGCYAGLVARAAAGDYSKWNANARGVDIAHNFNYKHERIVYENAELAIPSPYRYAGPSPESEPETKAIARLCEQERFRYAFLLSAGSEKIYWSEPRDVPCDTAMTAKILASVSGYPPCRKDEASRFGTFTEWFSAEHRRPAFEIMTASTNESLSAAAFELNYNKIEEMLILGAIM